MNYRIPDGVLSHDQVSELDDPQYISGPPPLVCIEFRSPNDENYEKLPFYAELGLPEIWIIDRDTKNPEVYLARRLRLRMQIGRRRRMDSFARRTRDLEGCR